MASALLIIAYTCFFLWLIRVLPFIRNSGIDRRWLGRAFLIKIAAGTALSAIYTYYYTDRSTADIFKYFDDGVILFSALQDNPMDYFRMLLGIQDGTAEIRESYYYVMDHWYREYETTFYNDAHTIIRWNAVVRLFSFGVFHVHTIFMSFCSLLGCVGLYRAFKTKLATSQLGLFAACFLIPSVLLWSSAPTKEGLLLLGLGLFSYLFFALGQGTFRFRSLLFLLLAALLIFFQKFYVLASMVPGLLLAWWAWRTPKPHWMVKVIVVTGAAIIGVLALESLAPEYSLLERLTRKQQDFINHGTATGSNSMIDLMSLDGTLWSFIQSIPYALYTSVFGPTVHLKGGALGIATNLENIVLLLSLFVAIAFRKKHLSPFLGSILLCAGFAITLFILIGWTTPVLGALVRYRTPALPFLLILSLILVDQERLAKRFPFLKRHSK